jgi:hypothetical protein
MYSRVQSCTSNSVVGGFTVHAVRSPSRKVAILSRCRSVHDNLRMLLLLLGAGLSAATGKPHHGILTPCMLHQQQNQALHCEKTAP